MNEKPKTGVKYIDAYLKDCYDDGTWFYYENGQGRLFPYFTKPFIRDAAYRKMVYIPFGLL